MVPLRCEVHVKHKELGLFGGLASSLALALQLNEQLVVVEGRLKHVGEPFHEHSIDRCSFSLGQTKKFDCCGFGARLDVDERAIKLTFDKRWHRRVCEGWPGEKRGVVY